MARNGKRGLASVDGGTLSKPATISGVVRTSKGYAVLVAVIGEDGEVSAIRLGRSQEYKEHVATEHKRITVAEALRA